jgi:hypothetical protein
MTPRVHHFLHSRPFQIALIAVLIGIAIWLRGERLAIGVLLSRVADVFIDVALELHEG